MGGRYTRIAPLQAARRDTALLGQNYFQFGNTNRQYSSNQALSTAQVGMQGYRGAAASGGTLGMRFNSTVASLSGLSAVVSPGVPLPETRTGYVPGIDACLYTPRPVTDRFQELLGLVPVAPVVVERVGSVAEQLEAATQDRVRRAEGAGLDLFKRATIETRTVDPATKVERYQECADCDEKLRQAIANLRLVGHLDGTAYLPYLLMAHAFLEQNRVREALDALLEAVKRHPDLVTLEAGLPHPFADYFGDARGGGSLFLDAQMRRYSRLGELNPNHAEALALEAYCTWRLGELARARDAARKLEALATKRPAEDGYLLDYATLLRDVSATPR
jgi:tetratricopeptide (TPR) repeat protein